MRRIGGLAALLVGACSLGNDTENWDPCTYVPYPAEKLPKLDCRTDLCYCGRAGLPWDDRFCPTGFVCQCCSNVLDVCTCVPEGEPQLVVCCSSSRSSCDGR